MFPEISVFSPHIHTPPETPKKKRPVSDESARPDFTDSNSEAENLDPQIASPLKYYPFRVKESGRIAAEVTPTASKRRKVIYKVKNLETGGSYTGKTAQPFGKRVSGHNYGINHPERDVGKRRLYQEIRENPDQFVIGIQKEEEGSGLSLEELEKICIAANRSFKEGYNANKGGGGGSAATPPANPPRTPKLTQEEAKTPQKGYLLDYDEKGRVKVQISPGGKKTRGAVYGFKNKEDGKWLIGETEQEIGDRLRGYHYAFSHPRRDCGRLPLPSAVREAPENFEFFILQKGQNDLKALEKAWIEAKEAYSRGYNQNRGGGGSGGCL